MQNKDITLPYELALKDLTLQEIGTIFTLFAIQKMDKSEVLEFAINDEYLETVNDLLTREFIKVSYDENGEMIMDIDLTDKEPEPFWDIYDYDDDGNPIYYHFSYYTDEDSPFHYRIKPVLRDMNILWVDDSDPELGVDHYSSFDSLEEAERYYTELLELESKQIGMGI